jgi:Fic family protein
MPFVPKFTITAKVARCLMRIEAAKQAVQDLPITPSVLATLRETARLFSTHYSTMIEGNRLTQEQVSKVIENKQHFPDRERDEKEVLGYYVALEKLERFSASQSAVTETHIRTLHGLVMARMSSEIAVAVASSICHLKPKTCRS